jgi:hypothetical protein
MAGLSLIVFPTLIAIGVAKHLSTPYENRTEESKKNFRKFIFGICLAWVGFEIMGQVEALISTVITLAGIYLCLFSGLNLFSSDEPKDKH